MVLQDPTPGMWGGIQFGSGSKATVKDWQPMFGPEARFTAHAQIKNGRLPLRGDAIQTDGKGRFLYIVWRDVTGCVNRRAKIYLESIDQAMIDSIWIPSSVPTELAGAGAGKAQSGGQRESKACFEILLPGRAKDGLPCCATVQPIRDWRPVDR